MTVYFVTFFVLISLCGVELCFDEINYRKRYVYLFIYFILIFQVGLRWEMGTDWIPYFDNFQSTDSLSTVFINVLAGFELGYGLSVFVVRSITENYSVFLLIHALIFYALVFFTINKLSPLPILSLLLFYAITMGVLGSNRQLIALAICLFSLKYVFNKEPIKFIFFIFLAFLFHTSALIFSIYYFLNRDIKPKLIWSLLLASLVIGYTSLPILFFTKISALFGEAALGKSSWYTDKSNLPDQELSAIGFIRRVIYFAIFYFYYRSISKNNPNYKLYFNGFFVGLLFYLTFSNSLLIFVSRGSLYFSVMDVFLISSLVYSFKNNVDRIILFAFFIFFSVYLFFQSIGGYSDLFIPYQGLFFNFDYKRNLY